jgi:hypothetical protein
MISGDGNLAQTARKDFVRVCDHEGGVVAVAGCWYKDSGVAVTRRRNRPLQRGDVSARTSAAVSTNENCSGSAGFARTC